jgi:membrane fusion protein, multidrug efflux system
MSAQSDNNTHKSKLSMRRLRVIGLVALVIAIGTATAGILLRHESHVTLTQWTEENSIPVVNVISPTITAASQEIVFPGNLRAYYDAPIYARVSGYLKSWRVDIGSHVKAGELLAEIETPELDQQLHQAEADLGTAQANEKLSAITAQRWQNMLASDSVSKQEADEKMGDHEAKLAAKAAAEANVARLREIETFKRIVAPFAGVVIARKTDVGALINAGAGAGQELFRVADTHAARVYVEVPQDYASFITHGLQAELRLPEDPLHRYAATVVDSAKAISENSRTMLVQLEAENRKGVLLPGAYAEVHFKLPTPQSVVRVPMSSILFRQHGLEVATVSAGNKVVLKHIEMGRDFGTEVEVVSGITAADKIVDSPSDSLADGDVVKVSVPGTTQVAEAKQ